MNMLLVLVSQLWAAPVAEPAVVHWVQTEDSAWVALHHKPEGDGPAVLLVHGISSNHVSWDLDDDRSLVNSLIAAGMDPWVLDLRGHGVAEHGPHKKRQKRNWSVDDYGRFDVPAALEFVREKTGQERVHFVGHSMGGMVAAVALSVQPDLPLRRMVVLGTPMDFSDPDPASGWILRFANWGGLFFGALPSPLAARIHARFGSPFPVDEMLFSDISSPAREDMYEAIVSPLFAGELSQLLSVTKQGVFSDETGHSHYLKALENVRIPTRVIAGRGDRVAPPDRVYGFFSGLKNAEKDFVIAGKATGFSVDYGHLDLPLGDNAEKEIFPLVVEWLRMGPEDVP
jgi:polyhydroxyalkanoate synthase